MKHICLIAGALVAAVAVAGPAAALSCLRPDAAASFQRAAQSDDIYVVLRGSLSFDPKMMPEFDGMGAPETLAAVPARFAGMALGPDGFTIPYQTELWLQPTCAGPWCGGLTPVTDAVAFARDNGDGTYVIDLDPCGGTVFTEPTPAIVTTITDCMAGRDCSPAR